MTADRSSEIADIKAMLTARIDDVAAVLAPDGRRNGRYWVARNPMRGDRKAGSFWINLGGPMAGTYYDAATGETGDMLRLIQGVRGSDFKDALAWARDFVGLADMEPNERARRVEHVVASRAAAETDAGEALLRARRQAMAMYLAARKEPFWRSPAHRYLAARGVDLVTLGRLPGALGWLSEHRERDSGYVGPVLLAAMTGPDGKLWAVHRTWLRADGSDKAAIGTQRRIWPSFGGAAIYLWRGSSKMSVRNAAACGLRETLVLCEGIEDGLSVAMGCPELRVWAAGSLANLALLRLPDCVDDVVVCADNDWGKPQAAKQLNRAVAVLVAQGRTVRVARSHVGKDANDLIRSGT